jgi:hypothetical protein
MVLDRSDEERIRNPFRISKEGGAVQVQVTSILLPLAVLTGTGKPEGAAGLRARAATSATPTRRLRSILHVDVKEVEVVSTFALALHTASGQAEPVFMAPPTMNAN